MVKKHLAVTQDHRIIDVQVFMLNGPSLWMVIRLCLDTTCDQPKATASLCCWTVSFKCPGKRCSFRHQIETSVSISFVVDFLFCGWRICHVLLNRLSKNHFGTMMVTILWHYHWVDPANLQRLDIRVTRLSAVKRCLSSFKAFRCPSSHFCKWKFCTWFSEFGN